MPQNYTPLRAFFFCYQSSFFYFFRARYAGIGDCVGARSCSRDTHVLAHTLNRFNQFIVADLHPLCSIDESYVTHALTEIMIFIVSLTRERTRRGALCL